MNSPAAKFRYTVRKMVNGYTGVARYYVFDLKSQSRVTVHALLGRDSAQAAADRLNILDICVPADQDSRPFEVRYAEAETRYREATMAAQGKPFADRNVGESFRVHSGGNTWLTGVKVGWNQFRLPDGRTIGVSAWTKTKEQ